MSASSTAYSQITGLQKETKQEIVATLLDYPILLEENKLLKQIQKETEQFIEKLENKEKNLKRIIETQELEIQNLEEQKQTYKGEIEKLSSYGFVYGQVNLNGWDYYSIGIDYIIREKVIIGGSVSYDNFYKNVNTNIKMGFKAF